MTEPLHVARVHAIHVIAPDIRVIDLRGVRDRALPPFSAGAHIDLHLGNGLVRQYSLANDPAETHRYVLAVARDAHGRGGSAFIHDRVRVGDELHIGAPRNLFGLHEGDWHTVLIAGGIGITPLSSMAQALAAQGRSWTLHYAMRDRDHAACLDMIGDAAMRSQGNGTVHTYCRAAGDARMDIASIVSAAGPDTHFYCCGSATMIAAYEAACAHLPSAQVHCEHFTPVAAPDLKGGFTVELARSRKTLQVLEGMTVLDALKAAGLSVPSSCHEGVCGMCETKVLEGMPDARDSVLTAEEKAAGKTMMVCCSGALSRRLVLDL